MFEERYAELERKNKHEAETAATAQKPKMTESSTMLEQAEGSVVAEAEAAHHSNEDANAAAASMKQAEGSLFAEVAATHNLGEDASAAAAHNLGEDANIAAATKEKAKKTGDMPRSQNSKNEKINGGDDEIIKLIEERRNIAKGDRHQLRVLSKRIKKCIRDRKRRERQENIQRIMENSEVSKVYHAGRKRTLIPKVKNDKATITSRKGIACVFGVFCSEPCAGEPLGEEVQDPHISETRMNTERESCNDDLNNQMPEFTQHEVQTAIHSLKKNSSN